MVASELLAIYVKEALLRARAEKGGDRPGDMTMLEKEDLEAVLGQMIVDFT